MKRITICSAVIEALKKAGMPLSVNELYEVINSNNLYEFKAKEPISVLKSSLRKHTLEVKSKEKKGISYFSINDKGKYELIS